MASWWELFPGRLEAELEDFRARGLEFQLDEELFRGAGRVLLRGVLEHEGTDVAIEILYPDLFPYLRPEVYAPDLSLERHQNPALKNLCLLDRATASWGPDDTGGWLVDEQVPYLLSLFAAGDAAMAEAEVPQGEPASLYFPGIAGAAVFVPEAALSLDSAFHSGSARLWFGANEPPRPVLRAALGELAARTHGRKTKVIARADEAFKRRFGGGQLQARWVRLDQLPHEFTADALFEAADQSQPGFGRPPWQSVAGGELAVVGIVFKEEVQQGVWEDGWLFAVRVRRSLGKLLHEGSYVVRGERLTQGDLGARIPKLARLSGAVVAQVGLGAIGAPLALELARNQLGELRLLEFDHVEAAQTVRWPLGLAAVGHQKLDALASFVDAHYPYTRVQPFPHRLGQTAERQGRTENEVDLVERFLDGASLVVDASAETGVQQLIADFARGRGLAQLFVSATEGGRGGQVALIVPDAGGCWYCWKSQQLEGAIPVPPSEDGGQIQPRGCASPTFTGASFDLLPVTAQGVRVAVASLTVDSPCESTVWVCEIPADAPGPPHWTTHSVPADPNCPVCSVKSAA